MVVFKLWNGTLYHFIIIVNKLISSYMHYYWSSEKLAMLFQHGLRGYPCSALPLRSLILSDSDAVTEWYFHYFLFPEPFTDQGD